MRDSIRSLVLLVAALSLGGCSSLRDMMPLESLRERDNQAEPAELTAITSEVQVQTLWSQDTGEGSEKQRLKLVPALYRGRLFTADRRGLVQALEPDTGKTLWRVETGAEVAAGPGVGEGLVLLGTSNAEVIALSEVDGSEKWRARVSSEVLAVPRAGNGFAVALSIDGRLTGISVETGKRAWNYDRAAPVLTLRGSSSPVLDGPHVLAGFSNGKLVNIDLYSGTPRWELSVTPPRGRSELERIVDIDADPVVAGGAVFVCTYQGDLAAVSIDTGVLLWTRPMSSYAGLTADWRSIYITDDQDRVWAVDPRNGSALWKQEQMLNRRLTAPAALGDYVLVGDLEGYVHWLSHEDGRLLARVKVAGASISAPPRVENGIAYVLADDGTLAALAPAPATNP